MSIYISNAIYLAGLAQGDDVPNRPIIGWHSVMRPDDITVTTGISSMTAITRDAREIWNPNGYERFVWNQVWAQEVWVNQVNLVNPTGSPINYIALFGHNFGSAGSTYTIQSRPSSGVSWSTVVSARVVASDRSIFHYIDDNSDLLFRILVEIPPTDGVARFRIAHIKMGRVLRLARPRYVGDVPGGMDIKVDKIGSRSYSGNHLGSVVVSESRGFQITQENNKPEFVRGQGLQDFFAHAHQLRKLANGPAETFFYAWRPDEYPEEIQYCGQTTSFSAPTNQRANGMMNWSMSGEAYE